MPIMCLIDASSRVATNHHDDLDMFTFKFENKNAFLFSNRMLLKVFVFKGSPLTYADSAHF